MTRLYVLLYNDDENVAGGSDLDRLAVQGVFEFLEPVSDALRTFGPVVIVKTGLGDPEELARELKRLDPRCVFNLAEAARPADLDVYSIGLGLVDDNFQHAAAAGYTDMF